MLFIQRLLMILYIFNYILYFFHFSRHPPRTFLIMFFDNVFTVLTKSERTSSHEIYVVQYKICLYKTILLKEKKNRDQILSEHP